LSQQRLTGSVFPSTKKEAVMAQTVASELVRMHEGREVPHPGACELDREDWGLTWNQALETGGVLVGKKVRIELNVEGVRSDAAEAS